MKIQIKLNVSQILSILSQIIWDISHIHRFLHQLALILTILSITANLTIIQAQFPPTNHLTVYIFPTNETNDQINDWLAQWEADLAEEEITIEHINTPKNADLTVEYLRDEEDDLLVTFFLHQSPLSKLSPVLFDPIVKLELPANSYELNVFLPRYALGQCEESPQFIDEHLEHFQQIIEASCALLNNDLNTALTIYDTLYTTLEDDRLINSTQVNSAWIHIQNGDTAEALQSIKNIDTAFEWLPYRAKLYALLLDYTTAIEELDSAIDIATHTELDDSTKAQLYKQRGDLIMLIYEWDRAMTDYNLALEFDNTYAEAYFARGILNYTMAQREEAIADFQTYLDHNPEGDQATIAQAYIDSIQTELDALGN